MNIDLLSEMKKLNNNLENLIEKDKEIERLQHNQEVSTKWEIKLTQKNTKLKEETKRLHSIIKEVREYIEENKDKYYRDYSWDDSYTDIFLDEGEIIKLLEILDKVEENK